MKKTVFKFGKWQRTKTNHGTYYFKNGKRVAQQNFDAANNRRKNRVVKIFVDSVEEAAKPALRKVRKKTTKPIALCRVTDRQNLYEQIKKDRRILFNKLSDEEFSALRIVVDIGRKKKANKGGISQQGHRTFIDLRKFKNFLGLNYRYNQGELHEPVNWTKRGVCKYQKSVALTVRRMRGERVLTEKTIKKYAIQQP